MLIKPRSTAAVMKMYGVGEARGSVCAHTRVASTAGRPWA